MTGGAWSCWCGPAAQGDDPENNHRAEYRDEDKCPSGDSASHLSRLSVG